MSGWKESAPTAVLILRDGTRLEGRGIGAVGTAAGEVCFNTAMTGYQEILTDPSYAGQIITFTFPHIGNVGANDEDIETVNMAAASGIRGAVIRADVTSPSNYRAAERLDTWLKKRGIIGIAGLDTRALTALIREKGMADAVIAHAPDGNFDDAALKVELDQFPGLEGLDLAKEVSTTQTYKWDETRWRLGEGYGRVENPDFHIVAIDYGAKRNILRCIADQGARVTVVPATATVEDIMGHNPDGIFLSNGPGDPAATGEYAVPTIQKVMETGKPVFGICLGHQLLGLALGGKTQKMHQGHHGANHPVKDLTTGKVEITSMNHGFAVDRDSLPAGVVETHTSLFDGSNAGLAVEGKPIFSVQYHPEASPGPHDAHYLFKRFINLVREQKGMEAVAE
ncbi:MAG: glutamine-hydrolyzing carbamoyl-phosphate synthase small subunit [Marinovum algicola]|uniref:glutamine-hydrolyzing carbamoyl-phosphate synthase small subunit n=1 Tax=Marinovum algicola TaxID=42444 RepID=UPI0032EA9307